MEWTAISGSWRKTNEQVEADVRGDVARILQRGDGIVTGGALGVDYIATDEALKHDPSCQQLKIIIPTPLSYYAAHYLNAGSRGIITLTQAHNLVSQLGQVKRAHPEHFIEMHHHACNEATYYDRNSAVIAAANSLFAYQVNNSAGTQDTIDKARAAGLTITHKKYTIA